MAELDFQGLLPRYMDPQQILPTPSTLDLLKSYSGLCAACASYNAASVSDVEIKLLSGKTEIKSHPFLDLWEQPNELMVNAQFIIALQTYLELTGEAYVKIVPGALTPVGEMYILPNYQITPRFEGKELVDWRYNQIDLTLEEVVTFFSFDPLNPYGAGRGPTHAAWPYLSLLTEDTMAMLSLLRKRGRPGALISPDGQLGVINAGLSDRLRMWWNSFTGARAGEAAVSPIPIKVDLLSVSSKDYQGSERAEFLKSLILNCYGIPSALFDSSASRAELDAALVQYARQAIDPRTTLLSSVITNKIAKLFDESLVVEFDWALPEDDSGQPKPDGSKPKIPTNVGEDNA